MPTLVGGEGLLSSLKQQVMNKQNRFPGHFNIFNVVLISIRPVETSTKNIDRNAGLKGMILLLLQSNYPWLVDVHLGIQAFEVIKLMPGPIR